MVDLTSLLNCISASQLYEEDTYESNSFSNVHNKSNIILTSRKSFETADECVDNKTKTSLHPNMKSKMRPNMYQEFLDKVVRNNTCNGKVILPLDEWKHTSNKGVEGRSALKKNHIYTHSKNPNRCKVSKEKKIENSENLKRRIRTRIKKAKTRINNEELSIPSVSRKIHYLEAQTNDSCRKTVFSVMGNKRVLLSQHRYISPRRTPHDLNSTSKHMTNSSEENNSPQFSFLENKCRTSTTAYKKSSQVSHVRDENSRYFSQNSPNSSSFSSYLSQKRLIQDHGRGAENLPSYPFRQFNHDPYHHHHVYSTRNPYLHDVGGIVVKKYVAVNPNGRDYI